MLVEEGFEVVSTDASDRMLKYALRQRWKRRKEPAFDKWSEYSPHRSVISLHLPGRVAKHCAEHVCMTASLSVFPLAYLKNHTSEQSEYT